MKRKHLYIAAALVAALFLGASGTSHVFSVADGAERNFNTFGARYITIRAGAGATCTISRIDSDSEADHDSVTSTVAAGTVAAFNVDWQRYKVSSAGGICTGAFGQ